MWASLVNLHLLLSFLVGMIVVIMIVIFSYLNHLTFWLHAMNANKVIDVIDTDVSDKKRASDRVCESQMEPLFTIETLK